MNDKQETDDRTQRNIQDQNSYGSLDLFPDSNISLEVSHFGKSSDDDIVKLLKKMETLLSPNDQSVFDSNGNKSVGDILRAADELVNSSSPLFEALSPTDSHNNSGHSQNVSSNCFKVDIPDLPLYNKGLVLKQNEINTPNDKIANNNESSSDNASRQSIKENSNAYMNKQNMSLNLNKNTSQNKISTVKNMKQNKMPNSSQKLIDNSSNINSTKDTDKMQNNSFPLKDKINTPNVKYSTDMTDKTKKTVLRNQNQNSKVEFKDDLLLSDMQEKSSISLTSEQNCQNSNNFTNYTENINAELSNKSKSINVIDKELSKNNGDENNSLANKINIISDSNKKIEQSAKSSPKNVNEDISVSHNFNSSPQRDMNSIYSLRPNLISNINHNHPKSERDREFNIGDALKISDLVTPLKRPNDLEEIDILKNKVRQLKEELSNTIRSHLHQIEILKISHEEEIVMLNKQTQIAQETEVKKTLLAQQQSGNKGLTPLDDQLLSSYDKENKRLCQEIKILKNEFREAELKWEEERSKLVLQIDQNENGTLKKQLKDARVKIKCLEHTVQLYKEQDVDEDRKYVIEKLENQNLQLMDEICELNRRINGGNNIAGVESKEGYELQSVIQKQNGIIQSKDAEINKLAEELKRCSDSSRNVEDTKVFRDLKSQLCDEKNLLKTISAEKEMLAKDNYDLKRQVKELEIIVKKRNTTGCLTITGLEFFPETEKIKQLELQVNEKDDLIDNLKEKTAILSKKYEANIEKLENQLKVENEKF